MFQSSFIADCLSQRKRRAEPLCRELFKSNEKKQRCSREYRQNSRWLRSKRANENLRSCKAKRRLNYDQCDTKLFERLIFNPVMEKLKDHSLNVDGIGVPTSDSKVDIVRNSEQFLHVPFYNGTGDRFDLNSVFNANKNVEFIVGWMPVIESIKVSGSNGVEIFKPNGTAQQSRFSSGYGSEKDSAVSRTRVESSVEPLASSTPVDRRALRKEFTYPDLFESSNYISLNSSGSSDV